MAYPSKITPQSILGVALTLLEADGPDALNMRAVASRLNVQASSLYRHYPDRAALLSAIEAQATLALHAAMSEAGERMTTPQARLSAAGHAYLTYATSHPHLYALLLAPRPPAASTLGPGKNLWNLVLGLVGEVSGDPDDTPRTVALWAYLHGFALMSLSGLLGLSGDQGGFQVGLETLIAGFGTAEGGAGSHVPAPLSS